MGMEKPLVFRTNLGVRLRRPLRFEIRADNKRFRESDCSLDHFASRVAFARTPLLERSLAVWHVLWASLMIQGAFRAWVGEWMMGFRGGDPERLAESVGTPSHFQDQG